MTDREQDLQRQIELLKASNKMGQREARKQAEFDAWLERRHDY